jgi:2-amino-4-hydroxy-6-hydroxymethyldihydropteridine diphosphokinase
VRKNKNINNRVFVALGSNKGYRIGYLRKAVKKIDEDSRNKVLKTSSVYETKPYGKINQSNFLNAVIELKSSYEMLEFFNYLKVLEIDIGRTKSVKWGPREIDLDLLFFGDVIFKNKELTVPHAGINERDFVLIPLKEIAPDYFHPALKLKISDICTEDISKTIIRKTRLKIN